MKQGMPQASMLAAKADAAVAAYEALKEGGSAPAPPAPVAAPASSVAQPAQITTSAVSPKDIAEAEKHSNLMAWAAKNAAEQGLPTAPQLQQSADQAKALLEALKAGESAPAAAVSTPAAAVAPTPATPVAATP